LYPILTARYRRRNQRGADARALIDAVLPDPRAVLESLVGELTEFHLDRPARSPAEAKAEAAPLPLPTLPPLAAALSAESHLLASLPSDARPPDTLGMVSVMRLMPLTAKPAGIEKAAVA
jgi:hypothetical protein